jgi:methylenetetrahydrofolate--tRNA-(uracil-5-)-methyltransferase
MSGYVTIIGAGLAGSEAAWQAAEQGVDVHLYEMRPHVQTPAHQTGDFAELVCSNSLRSNETLRGPGLLKEEMRRLDSLILRCADTSTVPAGAALAVDRQVFSRKVTAEIEAHPRIHVKRVEVTAIPAERPCIIASGPLTSAALASSIQELIRSLTGSEESLYFYDAISPIVEAESINYAKVFHASRYGKGEDASYLNCPMNAEQYHAFRRELLAARKVELHDFEKGHLFEGCLPIEELAARGVDTMRFGPLKPIGLRHPTTGEQPYAVVQLRQENTARTLFNLVGFQTRLLWREQERVFRMIPGLERAEFVRFGSVHRNTFINSPRLLEVTGQVRGCPGLFFAGQITGVEGYIESAASGLVAGVNAARLLRGGDAIIFPRETAIGALMHYVVGADPENFQPMNINFGLLSPLEKSTGDRKRDRLAMVERSLRSIAEIAKALRPESVNDYLEA